MIKTNRTGIQITFDNGVTVSIQNGDGTKNENYVELSHTMGLMKSVIDMEGARINNQVESETKQCEVAIWNKEGEYITDKYFASVGRLGRGIDDDTIGYVTAKHLLKILNWASNYKI